MSIRRAILLSLVVVLLSMLAAPHAVWADTETRAWIDHDEGMPLDLSFLSVKHQPGSLALEAMLRRPIELKDLDSASILFLLDTDQSLATGSGEGSSGAEYRVRIARSETDPVDPSYPEFLTILERWEAGQWMAVRQEQASTYAGSSFMQLFAYPTLEDLDNPLKVGVVLVAKSDQGSMLDRVPNSRQAVYDVQGDALAPFLDTHGGRYGPQIEVLAGLRIIEGFQDGTFHPEAAVKRQQFAKLVVLTLGLPVSESDICPFGDVDVSGPDKLYPDNYVAVCARASITVGTGQSRFSPWDDISRAQLITMVSRAADLPAPPSDYEPPFGDFSSDHYPWARRAAYAGLLDGINLGPPWDFWIPATRGEVAAILYNLLYR